MTSFLIELISDYGYLGMFIGMILEAIIIIIPSGKGIFFDFK